MASRLPGPGCEPGRRPRRRDEDRRRTAEAGFEVFNRLAVGQDFGQQRPQLGDVPLAVTRNGNKRYRYYVCSAAQKKGWQTCPSKSIPAGEIERFVVDQIRCVGRDPTRGCGLKQLDADRDGWCPCCTGLPVNRLFSQWPHVP
jgi:hypothetical protein